MQETLRFTENYGGNWTNNFEAGSSDALKRYTSTFINPFGVNLFNFTSLIDQQKQQVKYAKTNFT